MDSEILTAPAEAIPEPVVSPPAPRVVRAPGQMGYSDLRKRIKELEAHNADLTGRNEVLETRHAENRFYIEELLGKLAAYDRAEATLATAAEAQLKQAYAQFDVRAVSVRNRFPDFDQSLEGLHKCLRGELIRTILVWESAPFALYALAKNSAFCHSLQSLTLGAALERIFRFVLEAEQNLLSSSIAQTYLQLAKPAKEKHVRS
jgi:hypothetical protein